MSLTLIGPAYDEARQAREGAQGIQQALNARLPADRAERLDLRSAPRNAPVLIDYAPESNKDPDGWNATRYASASPEVTSSEWQIVLDITGRGVLHALSLRGRFGTYDGGTVKMRVSIDGVQWVSAVSRAGYHGSTRYAVVTTPLASAWYPADAQIAFDAALKIEIRALPVSGTDTRAYAYWTHGLR